MKAINTGGRDSHPPYRNLILMLRALFWFGVLWCIFGIVITFVPGGGEGWFTIGAVLVAFGILVPNRIYRFAAIGLVVFAAREAFDDHKRGIEYRQRLESRSTATPPPSHQA